MLGIEPQHMHYYLRSVDRVLHMKILDQEAPRHKYRILQHWEMSSDAWRQMHAVPSVHFQKSWNTRKHRIPKEGDLVVMRNHAVDSQKERKLESRWLGLRILVSYTAPGLSAYVGKLYGSGNTKRYQLNDLLLYNPRSALKLNDHNYANISRDSSGTAIIGERGGGELGSRAVLPSSRWEFSIAKDQGRYRVVGIILRREFRWESSRRADPKSIVMLGRAVSW